MSGLNNRFLLIFILIFVKQNKIAYNLEGFGIYFIN